MNAIELIIGEYTYRLPLGVDEQSVLKQLTEAVRNGGGVVELPAGAARTVCVLMSPGVPVFVERTPIPDDSHEDPNNAAEASPSTWPSL